MERFTSRHRPPAIGPGGVLPGEFSTLAYSSIDVAIRQKVRFYVLLGNAPTRVLVNPYDNLAELFARLRDDPNTSRFIPANAALGDYTFYKLITPVLFANAEPELQEGDVFLRQAKRKCKEAANRLYVEPTTTLVRLLAEQLFEDHAHLVIEPHDEYLGLFNCLQVKIERLGMWSWQDVFENQKGGIHTDEITELPPEFREIADALAQHRLYRTTDIEDSQDFQVARTWYPALFERVFVPVESDNMKGDPCTLVRPRELAAFYNVLRGFNDDAVRIAGYNIPSSQKASNFVLHFIQPPFFSLLSCKFHYQQNKSWDFPIFVDAVDPPNAFRKLTPRSDCIIFSSRFGIPFIICEAASDKQESNHPRILIQAIALARTGQVLLRSHLENKFFVVALYVGAQMVVSRYIVMQTEGDNVESDHKPVSIYEQTFDLRGKRGQVDFLREMYNLVPQVAALSDELDPAKAGFLRAIRDGFGKVKTMPVGNTTVHSTTVGSTRTTATGTCEEDDLGVFEAKDIQNILHQMHYEIEFIPFGHPHLAVIVNKTEDKYGYLKFVEQDNQSEVNILQRLTVIQSPFNHTISGVQFWPVDGGTVVSMPVAGGWLTSLRNPNEQLWSVALQLVEAVAFMHEHKVAHMDLKPRNIIIPPEGGHLPIIDFSISIFVSSPDATYKGIVGTEGYIAPEVRKGRYKPMLADLWSCGRTLEDLCARCRPSGDRETLLQISGELMAQDPKARPEMSAVLERMAPTRQGDSHSAVLHTTL